MFFAKNHSEKIQTSPSRTQDLSLSGKTVLVTGANAGVGFDAARQFLLLKASTLIITARSPSKCRDTIARLEADPEISALSPKPSILSATLSLDEYESVGSFVASLNELTDRLDVVVHNAAIGGSHSWEVSKDNHEMIFQTDYLSPAYLTIALLPILRNTATLTKVPSRYTWVSSFVQTMNTFSRIPLDRMGPSGLLSCFDDRDRFSWLFRYQNAKALASWLVAELAARIDSSEVILNTVCPGVVRNTGIDRAQAWYIGMLSVLWKRTRGHGVAEGARRYIHASVVAGAETHGQFLSDYSQTPLATLRSTEETKRIRTQAWDETIAEIQKADPSVTIP